MRVAGRSQFHLLDGDQLAAVGNGLEVSHAAFFVSVAEVVPHGGVFVEGAEGGHAPCPDVFEDGHGAIVSVEHRSDICE
jgi:hypothetical protein